MEELFDELKSVLCAYSSEMNVVHDEPNYYYLNTTKKDQKGKAIFFGMVKVGAKNVSFHLMPLYDDPSLANPISPALKRKMKGKSCFHFSKIQPELIIELGTLTKRCVESYQTLGRI